MSEFDDLYQQVILDHNRNPRNFHKPDGANREALGHNPLCGDKVKIYLKVADHVVQDAGFQGAGCAISTASASLMTERLKGMPEEEARRQIELFHEMLTTDGGEAGENLGKLRVFAGVKEYPVRVKCATLAWHTAKAALDQEDQSVTTE